MSPLVITLIVIGVLVAIAVFAVIGVYNKLVTLRNRADEAWSDIGVQLERRAGLIPNLVDTVKAYAAHEKETLQQITDARAAMMSGKNDPEQAAEAENMFEGALKSLFAVAEAYPDLKANQNYLQLQEELVDTEDKVQAARRFYNSGVNQFNTALQVFPNNIIAGMFSFAAKKLFEPKDRASKEDAPKVNF